MLWLELAVLAAPARTPYTPKPTRTTSTISGTHMVEKGCLRTTTPTTCEGISSAC